MLRKYRYFGGCQGTWSGEYTKLPVAVPVLVLGEHVLVPGSSSPASLSLDVNNHSSNPVLLPVVPEYSRAPCASSSSSISHTLSCIMLSARFERNSPCGVKRIKLLLSEHIHNVSPSTHRTPKNVGPDGIEEEEPCLSAVWGVIESALNTAVPVHIKRLLDLDGFDNFLSLKAFENEDICELEKFVTSGDLLKKVGVLNVKFYVPDSKTETFSVNRGTRKLLASVVEYVKSNHKPNDKNLATKRILNDMNQDLVLIPPKRCATNATAASACLGSKSDVPTVLSVNLVDELRSIRNILKMNCESNKGQKHFLPSIDSLKVEVKTSEGTKAALLCGKIWCPACGKVQKDDRLVGKDWNVSNMRRHLLHHGNGTGSNLTIDKMFSSSSSSSAVCENPFEDVDNDLECVDLADKDF
ncbi:hypothetical protein ONE63_010379 [Megalurothrips usitatus]|uniref:Uncharacterized protein n=1 Tax=Megalurothrips usitatus TaxID=439358 RepID=A0AAV7XKF5_9NEOP|nr:hypothetical protein ONE63_010379 [Megalurothrips usitatus]